MRIRFSLKPQDLLGSDIGIRIKLFSGQVYGTAKTEGSCGPSSMPKNDPYTDKSLKRKQNYHTRIKGEDVYVTSIDKRGVRAGGVWQFQALNSQSKERTGYPTQKPLDLFQRILHSSSSKGDMILDPFCGCATACVAADALDRNWVGIDVSPRAAHSDEQQIDASLNLGERGARVADGTFHTRQIVREISFHLESPPKANK